MAQIRHITKLTDNRRRELLLRNGIARSRDNTVYLWHHYATSGQHLDEYDLSVPIGGNEFAIYKFCRISYLNQVDYLKLFKGCPVINTAHGSLTKSGSPAWGSSTTTDAGTYGGTAARSATVGATISGTITGGNLFCRGYRPGNGGWGRICIDGDYTLANGPDMKTVVAADILTVTAKTNNGSLVRLTVPAHGIADNATGAKILVENVSADANGYFVVTVIDEDTLDLDGSTYNAGTPYGGTGGTCGYFPAAWLGHKVHNWATGHLLPDAHICLALGLSDGAHDVSIEVAGTRIAGQSDQRIYVAALAGGTSRTKPTDGDGSMAYIRRVHDQVRNGGAAGYYPYGSAPTIVYSIEQTGGVDTNIGSIHRYEQIIASAWKDQANNTLTPARDAYESGTEIRLEKTDRLYAPLAEYKTVTGAADNGSGLIRITAASHGLITGDKVLIDDVAGTTEANGHWTVTYVGATTFDLDGSTFANAYVSGGRVTKVGEIAAYHDLVFRASMAIGGMSLDYDTVWNVAGTMQAGYVGMLPNSVYDFTSTDFVHTFDRVLIGETIGGPFSSEIGSDIYYGGVKTDLAVFFSTEHDDVAVMYLPSPERNTKFWAAGAGSNAAQYMFMQNRRASGDNTSKIYCLLAHSTTPVTLTPGYRNSGSVIIKVVSIPDAAAFLSGRGI